MGLKPMLLKGIYAAGENRSNRASIVVPAVSI